VAGQSFADTPTALDTFHPGRLVSATDLAPFSVTLNNFRATYVTSGPEQNSPLTFNAALSYTRSPGASVQRYDLQVNRPLVIDGVSIYLIGHGYAPEFTVTDGAGKVVFSGAVPFIPVDQSGLTSEGVVKVPDASPTQLGFAGVFLPSAADENGQLVSVFPAPLQPRVSLVSYAGNLGLNNGASQSVYQLNTSGMHRLAVAPSPLSVGQSITLPHGEGKLTFTGYRQWISLAITHDPGQIPALISALVALGGLILSFMVRRRRVFLRAAAGPEGQTIVDFGGLARSDAAGGFEVEFAELSEELRTAQDGVARASGGGPGPVQGQKTPSEPAPAPVSGEAPGSAEGPVSGEAEQGGSTPVSSGNDQAFGSAEGE
jgi:cytochrome c biogenesis protein